MIKFFRNIRRSLLNENKMGKYFKYAFGEIILVVIGILIALQINNWNDVRKTKNYEQEILSLISQNLKNDSIALSTQIAFSKEATHLTDNLLVEVSKGIYSNDLNQKLGKIMSFEMFKSQSSAFEILKSKGIDVISDRALQLELISYYDQSLYTVYEALEDVEESFKADWTPVIKEDFLDYKWHEYAIPIDAKAFFSKGSNISFIRLYNENRSSGRIVYLEPTLKKISKIRQLINKHID